MLKNLQVVAALLGTLSYAAAGTVSIGTASARGDMRVDSYTVKGNATLFDGSVVETGQATADLRLDKGTQITMAAGTRGTLYRDRLVLQQGKSELAGSNSFKFEANGLQVTPSDPNSRGTVTMKSGNTVEVAALTGSFGVTNDHGVLLASVRPGKIFSFAMQAGGASSFSGTGTISFEDGHYFLTTDAGVKYELTGRGYGKYVGKKVEVTGGVQALSAPVDGAASEITNSSVKLVALAGGGGAGTSQLVISGIAISAEVGLAVGIYAYSNSSSGASR